MSFCEPESIVFGADPVGYHADGAKLHRGDPMMPVSNSMLGDFSSCPSRWIAGYKEEGTVSTEWGDLVDAIFTSPQTLDSRFCTAPETYINSKGKTLKWTRRSDSCTEWEEEQEAKGLRVVKEEQWSEAWKAVAALKNDARVSALMTGAKTQVWLSAHWKDEGTELTVPVKCLVDTVPDAPEYRCCLADLKCVQSAGHRAFQNQVASYHWHAQASLYLDVFNFITGEKRDSFLHVLSESCPPYQVGRRSLSVEFLELGRNEYISALGKYCRCLASNSWPDYDEGYADPDWLSDGKKTNLFQWSTVEPPKFLNK